NYGGVVDAAHSVQGFRLEPFDRAGPSGLHQVHDQHADDRCGQSDACRLERGRCEPSGVADPATALDHGPLARRAERPERAAAVWRVRSATHSVLRTAALGPPSFFKQSLDYGNPKLLVVPLTLYQA